MVDDLSRMIEENNQRFNDQEDRFIRGDMESISPIEQSTSTIASGVDPSSLTVPAGSGATTPPTAPGGTPPTPPGGTPPTPPTAPGGTPPTPPTGGGTTPPGGTPPPPPADVNVDDVVAGISSAYGIKPTELQSKAEPPKSKEPTPPKPSKEGKSGAKDNIMAVFWDMILEMYGWCIDKAVDIPLEFLQWVLYAKPNPVDIKKDSSMLDIAKSEKEGFIKGVEDTNKEAKKCFDEIDKNIHYIVSGEPTSWREISTANPGRLNEIRDYTTNVLVPSFRAYTANPDDPDAAAYKNFKKLPDILDKSTKKIKMIGSFGYSLAAIKILANEGSDYMPEGFTSKYNEIKKEISSGTINYAVVEIIANDIIVNLPTNAIFDTIRNNLEEIKRKASASDKSGIENCMKNINKEVTDADKSLKYKKHNVSSNACVYMGKILENIDKIYESCGTDVNKRNEAIMKYCEHIDTAIKEVSEKATDADENIRCGGKAGKSRKAKFKKAIEAVNSFDFDGVTIGAHASPTRRSPNIYSNKNAIYDYMVGRV